MLPDQYNPETDPQEQARERGFMLRTGTVAEVDVAKALVRFKTGDITTDWLPWFERRAGGAKGGRTWWPPIVGEQGMLLAPGGELSRAVVLPGMFSTAMPAGERTAGVAREDFNATDFWQWKSGELQVNCTDKINLKVGDATLTITTDQIHMAAGGGSLTVGGGLVRVNADVIAGTISLVNHIHSGVVAGPELSGPPFGHGGSGEGSGDGSWGNQENGTGGGPLPDWLAAELPNSTTAENTVRYLASFSRIKYQGDPEDWGTISPFHHYNLFANLPADPEKITEEVFYQRVRPSMWNRIWQIEGAGYQTWSSFVASTYDREAEKWVDDVIDTRRDHIGTYGQPLGDGVAAAMPGPPYDVFRSSRTGVLYAALVGWAQTKQLPGACLPIIWTITARVCWVLTEDEWAENGTPDSEATT